MAAYLDYHSRMETFFNALNSGELGNVEYISMLGGREGLPFQIALRDRDTSIASFADLHDDGLIVFHGAKIRPSARKPGVSHRQIGARNLRNARPISPQRPQRRQA